MFIRDIGREVISTVVKKQKNIDLLEEYIYNSTNSETEYKDVIYNSVHDLNCSSNVTENVKILITRLFNNQYGWNDVHYDEYRQKQEEEDHHLTNPLEIEEGVLECKCGSKRTISFQRQTRSADEGSTTFAQCVECGNRWRHSN